MGLGIGSQTYAIPEKWDGAGQSSEADAYIKRYKEVAEATGLAFKIKAAKGAIRKERKHRYHLIVPCFKKDLAKALGEGEVNYSATNYQHGDYSFAVETFNHLQEHLDKFATGDTTEDHLGHAAANLMFLSYYRSKHPEWFKDGIIKADPAVPGKVK